MVIVYTHVTISTPNIKELEYNVKHYTFFFIEISILWRSQEIN